MNDKFEMTDITKEIDGVVLYQIRALRDFGNVKNGELGGWLEKAESLSQDGDSWVYPDVIVFKNAMIFGGEFCGGVFWDGVFWDGEFRGGEFRGGVFWDGEFWDGEFRGGEFRGGVFKGGEFNRGNHH